MVMRGSECRFFLHKERIAIADGIGTLAMSKSEKKEMLRVVVS